MFGAMICWYLIQTPIMTNPYSLIQVTPMIKTLMTMMSLHPLSFLILIVIFADLEE
jgi:hypothetical protein